MPWRILWQPTPVFLPGESPWTREPGGLQSTGLQNWTRLKRLHTSAQPLIYRWEIMCREVTEFMGWQFLIEGTPRLLFMIWNGKWVTKVESRNIFILWGRGTFSRNMIFIVRLSQMRLPICSLSLFWPSYVSFLFNINSISSGIHFPWPLLEPQSPVQWLACRRHSIPMCVCAKSLQSCLTLHSPMDCSPPGSSVHGISQTKILEWVAISFSRGSSQPNDQSCVSLHLLRWQVGSSPLAPPGRGSIHMC